MNTSKLNLEIVSPKNQLHLFGYKSYFNFFVELFKKKKLPNTMLLSGSKGLGKSTFVYHFANYILSKEEGGSHTPFFQGYRPQFYFRTTDITGQCDLGEEGEMVMPGHNVNLTATLINPIAMEEGLRFAIREGGRTVGAGVVSKIFE